MARTQGDAVRWGFGAGVTPCPFLAPLQSPALQRPDTEKASSTRFARRFSPFA